MNITTTGPIQNSRPIFRTLRRLLPSKAAIKLSCVHVSKITQLISWTVTEYSGKSTAADGCRCCTDATEFVTKVCWQPTLDYACMICTGCSDLFARAIITAIHH